MVTTMLILTVGVLAIAFASWPGTLSTPQGHAHRTDLMAGDEGED